MATPVRLPGSVLAKRMRWSLLITMTLSYGKTRIREIPNRPRADWGYCKQAQNRAQFNRARRACRFGSDPCSLLPELSFLVARAGVRRPCGSSRVDPHSCCRRGLCRDALQEGQKYWIWMGWIWRGWMRACLRWRLLPEFPLDSSWVLASKALLLVSSGPCQSTHPRRCRRLGRSWPCGWSPAGGARFGCSQPWSNISAIRSLISAAAASPRLPAWNTLRPSSTQ